MVVVVVVVVVVVGGDILRELLIKKCSFLLEFFHKGGGVPRQSKSFWTLFVHQPFWNFGQKKGGGLTKSRIFGHFLPWFW